jgi:hypothetical protein
MVRSRMMRWVGHGVHVGENRNAYQILLEGLKGGDHSEDQGVDGRIILT